MSSKTFKEKKYSGDRMKIENKVFKDFIRKASFGGSHMSINLDFAETGIKSAVKTLDNIGLSIVELNKDAIEEYEAIGEVFIKDTRALSTYLKTMKEDLTLTFEDEYTLKIEDENGRKIYVLLGDKIVCENVFRDEMPVLDNALKIEFIDSKNMLDQAVKDMNMLKENKITLNLKENHEMHLEVGKRGESDYAMTRIICDEAGVAKTTLGATFINLYDAIGNTFDMYLKTNMPLKVEEHTPEGITATYFIAPVVEE